MSLKIEELKFNIIERIDSFPWGLGEHIKWLWILFQVFYLDGQVFNSERAEIIVLFSSAY